MPASSAFLFADVVDSVALSRATAAFTEGPGVVDQVESVFREEVQKQAGDYYFREGDRFQAVFLECADALTAACGIVARLNAQTGSGINA